MNIATLGVAIDPKEAESGAKRAKVAAETVEKALTATDKAAKGAQRGMEESASKSATAFGRMVASASRAANGMTSVFGGISRGAFGMVRGVTDALGKIGLAIDGLNKITMPARGFLAGVFGKASEMENFTVQWARILGGFDKAKEKMDELYSFAKATPFELPDVTSAALKMAKLKDAGLMGMEGIKLVGDAAAAAGVPIQEVAERVARLVSSMKAGTGGGEPLGMLREWRIMSAETGMKISELAQDPKNYASALKLMVSELKLSNDAMILASTTWTGLTSSFGDAWGGLQEALGTPLLQGLKPLLVDATGKVESMTDKIKGWAPAIKEFGAHIAAAFRVLTKEGGVGLALAAAGETFTALIQRGFQIAVELLADGFRRIAHGFTEAMKLVASESFWKGVGRALVAGVEAALAALKGGVTDNIFRMVGGTPANDQRFLELQRQMQYQNDDKKAALERQADPGRYGPKYYSGTAGAEQARKDAQVISENSARLQELSKALAAVSGAGEGPWAPPQPAEAPPSRSIGEIISGLGPLPTGPAMLEFQSQMKEQLSTVGSISDQLDKQAADILAKQGGPKAELFPSGANVIDLTGGGNPEDGMRQVEAYDRVIDNYTDGLKKARFEQKLMGQESETMHDKMIKGWTAMSGRMQEFAVNAAKSITGNISTAMTDLISGTKSAKEAFSDMSRAIVADILKMTTEMITQIAYAKILGWVKATFGGAAGAAATVLTAAQTNHTGGDVGSGGHRDNVPSWVFAGAQRYHGGGRIGSDEVPIIAQKGETVLTRDQARAIRDRVGGTGEGDGKPTAVTIINVLDPELVADYHAKNPDAILNILSPRQTQVRQMVNSRKV